MSSSYSNIIYKDKLSQNFNQRLEALKNSSLLKDYYEQFSISAEVVNQSSLEERFSRRAKNVHNITLEFTSNIDDIAEYHRVCKQIYKGKYGFDGQIIDEEVADYLEECSHYLVAKSGGQVVGGVKATILNNKHYNLLSGYNYGCDVIGMAKKLKHNEDIIELSKLALLPEFRSFQLGKDIFTNLKELAISKSIKLAFIINSTQFNRLYAKYTSSINLAYCIISKKKMFKETNHNFSFAFIDLTVKKSYIKAFEKLSLNSNSALEGGTLGFVAN